MQQAEKYVLQGKISQAIAEYHKIAEEYPSDMSLLNTIGDLCVRQGYVQEAIGYFIQIAEYYLQHEFTLRAIAMYKKISNLDPQNLETSIRLAELYAKQGLSLESKRQYLLVADAYSKSGMQDKAITYYKKITELDPQDADVSLKLADIYLSQGITDQAKLYYSSAGLALTKSRLYQDGARAFKKALDLDGLDIPTLKGFLDLCLVQGPIMIEQAIQMLEAAYKQKSDNADVLEMLGEAYLAVDRPDKSEKAFQEALGLDRERFNNFFTLGYYFYNKNRLDQAAEQMNPISNILISRREPEKAVSFLEEILEIDPKHLACLFKLAEVYYKTNNEQKYVEVLGKISDTYIEQENYLEALNVLEKLLQVDFSNPKFHALHKQIFMEVYPEKEYAAFQPTLQEPTGHIEEKASAPVSQESPTDGEEIDLSMDLTGSAPEVFELDEIDKQPAMADSTLASNLQEIDFYIRLGFYKEAEDRLKELEKNFPQEKAIQLRYRQIEEERGPQASPPSTEPVELLEEFEKSPAAQFKVRELEGIKPSGNEAAQDMTQLFANMIEEARTTEEERDFRTHYDLGIAYKEMGLMDEAIGEFQEAYRLAKSKNAYSYIASCCTLLATCLLEKGMPGSAVKWCKFGLSASGLSDDEAFALKYELASAYEKCGELKLALDCLNEIYEMNASYRDAAKRINHLNDLLNAT